MELTHEEHRELQYALEGDLEVPANLASRLEKHLPHCPDCQRIINTSGRLRQRVKKSFQASVHLSRGQLLFHLTAMDSHADLPAADRKMLQRHRAHLQRCSLCRSRERHLQEELARCEEIVFGTVEKFALPAEPVQAGTPFPAGTKPNLNSMSRFTSKLMKTTMASVGILTSYLLIFFASEARRSNDFAVRDMRGEDLRSCLQRDRDRASDEANPILQAAHEALIDADVSGALDALAGVDERELEGEALFRFRLYELLSTLKEGQSDYLGFFPHFNEPRIAAALKKMEQALPENQSYAVPPDPEFVGPAYYFAAKACLILERRDDALAYLERSRSLHGHGRSQKAGELLQQLSAPK